MMFGCDLDGTLIYSYRSFGKEKIDSPIRCIETNKGKELSFMTEKAIMLLHDLSEKMMFIPVTTRTIEQYNRITLFKDEIRPTYAVVCNGGVVLKDGQVDLYWQEYIRTKVSNGKISVTDIKRKIEETSDATWLESIRVVDLFFICIIINPDCTPLHILDEYSKWAEENDLLFSIQGRRVYFIPSFINKWDAVQYIAKKEDKKTVFAAGDSLLDVDLVEKSTFGLIPRHGSAAAKYAHLGLTQKKGVSAAEEIIEMILSRAAGFNF
ncbi:HAD hydrolase family protein [Sporosarcina sp. FA9]|uniref:HAD hydrolase family protein n=1 Tax=Sporosarcina sp. FA9 TaxID=3413030 RepID=UPI003F6594DE